MLELAALFCDHMVIQRDKPIVVWGWTQPAETVEVELFEHRASGAADGEGRFEIKLPPMPAGGPHTLTVATKSDRVTCQDVLIGDVWLCSGQSNMEWPVGLSNNADAEIAGSSNPSLRMFTVAKAQRASGPAQDVRSVAGWQVAGPQTTGGFSGVGYFFGRQVQRELDVPIGLIHTSWGGTRAEAWTSLDALRADPMFSAAVAEAVLRKGQPNEPHDDPGNKGATLGWQSAELDDANWSAMRLPTMWENTGLNIDGAVWFRRQVDVPAELAQHDLVLSLGAIDDFDVTYFNGEEVGSTDAKTPTSYSQLRRYVIPARLVSPGQNVIAVRVFDQWGNGGFAGPDHEMTLVARAGANGASIVLTGEWKYAIELELPPRVPGQSVVPAELYNAMLAPLAPFAVSGAIWYQGESNAGEPAAYRTLLRLMIRDWRRTFGQGEFPFYIVQLANFMPRHADPGESRWAELRESQAVVANTELNCGLAVAIDCGDPVDIHPRDKQTVAQRLAQLALGRHYQRATATSGVTSGPTLKSCQADGSNLRVMFQHTAGGLQARGGVLVGFAIAGADGPFHWAHATITGPDSIELTSPNVPAPTRVRYAWADNPLCNLYNVAGLPAGPFQAEAGKHTAAE